MAKKKAVAKIRKETISTAFDPARHPDFEKKRGEQMQKVFKQLEAFARSGRANILLHGPSGTGKELLTRYCAHLLWKYTDDGDRPFGAVNCASIRKDPGWVELFGLPPDVWDGCPDGQPGIFEICAGGMLFLDEIGDLSKRFQAGLLRALDPGEAKRLGEVFTYSIKSVRIIAATEQPLESIRPSLRARLGIVVRVPGLDQRTDEIGPAIELFARKTMGARLDMGARSWGKKAAKGADPLEDLARKVRTRLVRFAKEQVWPSNFRTLRNYVEWAICQASLSSEKVFLKETAKYFKEIFGSAQAIRAAAPNQTLINSLLSAMRSERFQPRSKDGVNKLADFIARQGSKSFYKADARRAMGDFCANTVLNRITELLEAGYLERVTEGDNRGGEYQLVQHAQVAAPAAANVSSAPASGWMATPDASVEQLDPRDRALFPDLIRGLDIFRGLYVVSPDAARRTRLAKALAQHQVAGRPVLWWSFHDGNMDEFLGCVVDYLLSMGMLTPEEAEEAGLCSNAALAALIAPKVNELSSSGALQPLLVLDGLEEGGNDSTDGTLQVVLSLWTVFRAALFGPKKPNFFSLPSTDLIHEVDLISG